MKCPKCHSEFDTATGVGKSIRFCKRSCMSSFYVKRRQTHNGWEAIEHTFTCKQCNAEVTQRIEKSRLEKGTVAFCGFSCRSKWQVTNKIGTAGLTNEERLQKLIAKHGEEEGHKQFEAWRAKVFAPENFAKGRQTRVKNGTYRHSRVEKRVYETLVAIYGRDAVEWPSRVNGWEIDLKIRDPETYIQVDGVFWHGLDRPLEQIRNSSKPIDALILSTHLRDQEQAEWFSENGLRLIRITDLEVNRLATENRLQQFFKDKIDVSV